MLSLTKIFVVFLLMFSLDCVYLFLMKNAFSKQIELVQGAPLTINILATVLCYVSLVLGLSYFIIDKKKHVFDAFLLGIMVYSVYDTTTVALLKKWKWSIAIADTLWGGTLFALTTAIFYRIFK